MPRCPTAPAQCPAAARAAAARCLHRTVPSTPPELAALPLARNPSSPRAAAQVWWEGDQTFYSGILALYDAVSTE